MLQSKVPWPQAEQAKTMRLGGLWQKQGLTHKEAKKETGQTEEVMIQKGKQAGVQESHTRKERAPEWVWI